MKEFASRNKAEIAQVREASSDELAWMWGANRQKKLGELEEKSEATEADSEDPSLTPTERVKARNLLRQLIRDMNEMTVSFPPGPQSD